MNNNQYKLKEYYYNQKTYRLAKGTPPYAFLRAVPPQLKKADNIRSLISNAKKLPPALKYYATEDLIRLNDGNLFTL